MFREIRRKDRALPEEEALRILSEQSWGTLCVSGDDGYPYGVPVNYGYRNGKLYIHGTSQASHKLDGIRRNDKVSFTVVKQHDLVEEEFSTNYSSVIVFGRARIIEDPNELRGAMMHMMAGLAPAMLEKAEDHCKHSMGAMAMIEITPEHITGKARRSAG